MEFQLVFFDGFCSLCNAAVDWLIRHDPSGVFQIASLQGETATALLPFELRSKLDSIVVRDANGRLWQKSEALLRLVSFLPYPWRLLSIFRVMPRRWRDGLYEAIARRRYQIFGRQSTCRRPKADELRRFLP